VQLTAATEEEDYDADVIVRCVKKEAAVVLHHMVVWYAVDYVLVRTVNSFANNSSSIDKFFMDASAYFRFGPCGIAESSHIKRKANDKYCGCMREGFENEKYEKIDDRFRAASCCGVYAFRFRADEAGRVGRSI